MASTILELIPLGDSKHGGALFTLPREIRDEIYRLLVKDQYLVFRHTESKHGVSLIDREAWEEPDLIILRISKAISREAQQILYSESIFRYEVPFWTTAKLRSSKEAVNRMRKIELDIHYGLNTALTTYYSNQARESLICPCLTEFICSTILGDFAGTNVLRDTLRIIIRGFTLDDVSLLRSQILPQLCALNGFRTLSINVSPRRSTFDFIWPRQYSKDRSSNTRSTGNFELVKQTIKDAMEPTLGSATTRDECRGISVVFHPREHAPAILRAQAQKLMMDADRLKQGG